MLFVDVEADVIRRYRLAPEPQLSIRPQPDGRFTITTSPMPAWLRALHFVERFAPGWEED